MLSALGILTVAFALLLAMLATSNIKLYTPDGMARAIIVATVLFAIFVGCGGGGL